MWRSVGSRAAVPKKSRAGERSHDAVWDDPSNPENPLDPDETSNSVASPSGRSVANLISDSGSLRRPALCALVSPNLSRVPALPRLTQTKSAATVATTRRFHQAAV